MGRNAAHISDFAAVAARQCRRDRAGGRDIGVVGKQSRRRPSAAHDRTADSSRIVALNRRGEGVAANGRAVPGALPGDIAGDPPIAARAVPFCRYYGACGGCAAQHMPPDVYAAWKRDGRRRRARPRGRAGAKSARSSTRMAPGVGARRFMPASGPMGASRSASCAPGRTISSRSTPARCSRPSSTPAPAVARAIAEALKALSKPLDIQTTATLAGLDVDVRGSGPLGPAETRKLLAVAETLRSRAPFQSWRPADRAAAADRRLRPGARDAAGRRLPAGDGRGRRGARAPGARGDDRRRAASPISSAAPARLRSDWRKRHAVFAADNDAAAIAALRRAAAETPGLKGVEAARARSVPKAADRAELSGFDAVLFDPPRAGADAQAREIAASGVKLVVAISCNADTFARDARTLTAAGYACGSVTPLDQFRWSPHVEIFAVFRRRATKPPQRSSRVTQQSRQSGDPVAEIVDLGEPRSATAATGLLEKLARIVGPTHVLTDADAMEGALVEPRGLYRGPRAGAGAPRQHGRSRGRRRGLRRSARRRSRRRAAIPGSSAARSRRGPEIVLSLKRLNRVREVDPLADSMIVEAGVTLAEAQAAAERADRLFPLSLASEGSCTIGGNLSTNAGGVAVLAYGNARELTTGVEVVLPDGRIVNALSKLRKDNTGYDLKDLFIGAEGTLGDHHRGGAKTVRAAEVARDRLRRPRDPGAGAGAVPLARGKPSAAASSASN